MTSFRRIVLFARVSTWICILIIKFNIFLLIRNNLACLDKFMWTNSRVYRNFNSSSVGSFGVMISKTGTFAIWTTALGLCPKVVMLFGHCCWEVRMLASRQILNVWFLVGWYLFAWYKKRQASGKFPKCYTTGPKKVQVKTKRTS